MAVRRMLGGERTSLTGAKIQTESTSMFFGFFLVYCLHASYCKRCFHVLIAWKLSENLHHGYGVHLVSSFLKGLNANVKLKT